MSQPNYSALSSAFRLRPSCIGLLFLAGLASLPPAVAAPVQPVYEKAQQSREEAMQLLQRLVNIDSGTGDEKGVNQVGSIMATELKKLGAHVEFVSAAPAKGQNIVATLTGTGKGRILLISHMDTVFREGTVHARPFQVRGNRGYGPGVADDKGGDLAGLYALKILKSLNFHDYGRITWILNTNEETGSTGSKALIASLAKQHDVALNLEPGRAADGLVVWRKGSGVIEVDVKGRAAHAGMEPERGRNAAMEAAHQILQLSTLGNKQTLTTVNFTVLKAGDRNNVIPDTAVAKGDVRVAVPEEFDRVERDLQRVSQQHLIPDTEVKVSLERHFPPMPQNAKADALAAKAQAIYGEIGHRLTIEGSGGAADSSFAAGAGTPTLDGLGIVGGRAHSPEEYLEMDSIVPRFYLLARMLMELGPSGH